MQVDLSELLAIDASTGFRAFRVVTVRDEQQGVQRVDRPVLNIYRDHRNVDLTPDQRALVKRAIESGRFSHEEEAVQEALALWEERERRRVEILAALDEADASLARGEGRLITDDSMKALAEDVKQRGRRRLAAERSASR